MGGPFSVVQWLQVILLGGVAGAIGQGVRTLVGFKKLNDAAAGQTVQVGDLVSAHRLFVPLLIGFFAGALAGASTITDLLKVTAQQVLALVGAGYAGADFIEGFMTRIAPASDVAKGQESVGVAGGGSAPSTTDGSVG
jgi:hypothetical protein